MHAKFYLHRSRGSGDIRGRQIRLVQFSNDFVKKTTGSSTQIRLVRCTYTIVKKTTGI